MLYTRLEVVVTWYNNAGRPGVSMLNLNEMANLICIFPSVWYHVQLSDLTPPCPRGMSDVKARSSEQPTSQGQTRPLTKRRLIKGRVPLHGLPALDVVTDEGGHVLGVTVPLHPVIDTLCLRQHAITCSHSRKDGHS